MKTRLTVSILAAVMMMAAPTLAQPAGDKPANQPTRDGQPQPGQPGGPGGGRGGQPGGPGGGRGEGRGGGGSVKGSMGALRDGLKALKENIGAADKKDQNLAAITQMQRAAVNAKNAKPNNLKGDDQAKAQDGFRRAQIQLLSMLIELETQVMDGKTDAAKATVKKIEDFEDKAHDQFVKEKEGEKEEGGRGGKKPDAPAEKK